MFVFQTTPHPVISRKLLAIAIFLCAAGTPFALNVDHQWSASIRGWGVRGDLRKGIELSEVFGHSLGVAAILLAVYRIAYHRRKMIWWAICLTALSGLTANLMKGIVPRVRPHSLETLRIEQPEQSGQAEQAMPRTLGGAAEEGLARPAAPKPLRFWDSRQRSFPSGHSATAWGLAMGLSFVFPRGTLLFAVFASLASFQRVYSGAHFPSDVLAGAAIAFAWTWLLLSTPKTFQLLNAESPPSHPSPEPQATSIPTDRVRAQINIPANQQTNRRFRLGTTEPQGVHP